VWKGSVFKITAMQRDIWFKVISVSTVEGVGKKAQKGSVPSGKIEWGMVDMATEIECTEKPIKRDKAMGHLKQIGYQDIGGLGDQVSDERCEW
jgi:hypothetical protein